MLMPTISLDSLNLSFDDLALVLPIISSKGKNKGRLRASKPSEGGDAAYVWRMVAFQISPISSHHCMPVCADFDIQVPDSIKDSSERYDWRRNRAKELNNLVDQIVNAIPATEWHGIKRWHRAFYG